MLIPSTPWWTVPVSDLTQALICPRCFAGLSSDERCAQCGLTYSRSQGLLDVVGADPRESQAAEVEDFYTSNPFPGYAPAEDAGSLLDRSRRSPFLSRLDAAIPPVTRVLDCGCGTAHLAAFLALAGPNRRVFGVDGCRRSLQVAEDFRLKVGATNLHLIRADLFDLPVTPRSFDVVVSRGVVHHTPDPYRAIGAVADAVAPGGYLILGFYERMARTFHRGRRALGRCIGREISALDPVLRSRRLDAERKRIWVEDQYRHPLERSLALPRVVQALEAQGLSWVRTVPPMQSQSDMFGVTPRPGVLWWRRAGWMARGLMDSDAGLVFYIARRS